jgi:hypothetical protein
VAGPPSPSILFAAVALLLAPVARAEDAAGADESRAVNWATFAYVEPAPESRLRLGLELLGAVSVATIGYLIVDPPPSYPGVRTPIWAWEKLTFQPGTWVFDADDFGTNLAGHPTSGTVYYLIARGNRVGIPEAFLWTFGASLLWELAEHKEPVSINDVIVTPVAGLAIGEAFTQLSAWFDRSGEDALSKALAWIFNPVRKLHDWIDRAVPDRDPRARGWHEFQAFGGGGFVHQVASGANYPVAQLGVGSRLFHAPGYGSPGRDRFAFGDGNASRIGLGVTFTGSQVVDFLFDTETALAGVYLREIDGSAEEPTPTGWDLLVGGTVGYEYGFHRWDLRSPDVNRIALVRLPGLSIRPRLFAGSMSVALGLDAALTFGGVQPLALQQPASFPVGTAFPPVLLGQGYYFALGFRLAPSLEFRYGPAAAGAAACLDLLTGLTDPNVVAIPGRMAYLADQRTLVTAWARWRVPDPSIEFALAFLWRSRSGSADEVRASQQERSVVGSLGVVF